MNEVSCCNVLPPDELFTPGVSVIDICKECRPRCSAAEYKIHHEREGGIEKSLPRIHRLASRGLRTDFFLIHPLANNGILFLLTTEYRILYNWNYLPQSAMGRNQKSYLSEPSFLTFLLFPLRRYDLFMMPGLRRPTGVLLCIYRP